MPGFTCRASQAKQAEHGPSVALLASRLARALGGRTLLLTATTLRNLRVVADGLRNTSSRRATRCRCCNKGGTQACVASALPRQPASVLVGSATFWESIDVPGDALQCVITSRLPPLQ